MIAALLVTLAVTAASSSRVRFQAAPATLLANLSDSASMRCDVTDSQGPSDTQLKHISSIFITKEEGVDVASVTLFDPPTAQTDANNLEVKGSISASSSEGFLQLSWMHPELVYLGDYNCEVTGVDARGHTKTLTSTLILTSAPPSLTDVIYLFKRKFNEQEATISKLQNDNGQLTKLLHDQEATISKQHNETYQINKLFHEQQATLSKQQIEIDQLNTKLEKCFSTFVSFDAAISYSRFSGHTLAISYGQIVVFDDVSINQGGAYNPATGAFTCNVSGVYEFQVHALGETKQAVALQLEKNGQELVDLLKHVLDVRGDAFLSHIVELKIGDVVSVKSTYASVLYGEGSGSNYHGINYFKGKLLHIHDCLP